jgi:type I restriction enzyme S subunit
MKKYEKYKNSGVKWIDEIPESWETVKLKRISRFAYGDSLSEENRIEGEISVYGSNGIVGFHNKSITKAPCLIIGRKGSYGKINYSEKECFPIDTAFFIDETQTKNNLKWLYYYLGTLGLDENTQDDTVPGLSREWAYRVPCFLPPLSEQAQIVSYLDNKTGKIDAFITDRKQQIELLKEQKAVIINSAITKGINPNAKMKPSGIEWIGEIPEHWKVWKMKFLSRIETGDKNTDDAEEDGIYPFFVRSDKVERLSTYSFDGEAILTAGDGVGVAKVFHYANCKMAIHQRVYKISHFKNVFGEYLYHYIKDNFYKEVIKLSAKTTVDSLRMHMLANFPIVFPDKSEQQLILTHIASETSQIEELINKYQKQIELMQEYRTTLISQVVTGKIDVREWKV